MPRFEDIAFGPTTWSVVASQTNATATATRAATAGTQHFLNGFTFSASAAPAAAVTLQVLDGATVIDQVQIPAVAQGPLVVNYSFPMRITTGNAVSVSVPALGAGVVGTVVLKGKSFKAA